MPESNRVAVAAHLHLMMRRRLGRVTDVEWMAQNREYAMAMIRLCREAEPDAELLEWAAKLQFAYGDVPVATAPVLAQDSHFQDSLPAGRSGPSTRPMGPVEPRARYVASLR